MDEQKPVAWLSDDGNVMFGPGPKGKFTRPLYTHPPKQEPVMDKSVAKFHYSNTDNPVDFPSNESQLQPVWNSGPTNQDYEEAMRIKRLNKLTRREWKGLTDEAIWWEYQRFWPFHPSEEPTLAKDIVKFARAIEAKSKEKNQ